MKVISSVMGTAAIQMSSDDTNPKHGILQPDLSNFVSELYKFRVPPAMDAGSLPAVAPVLQFQSGEFMSEDGKIPVLHLFIATDGAAVIASNTDLADAILTDYTTNLDRVLNYRFAEANPARMYASIMVVEFDSAFVEKTQAFKAIGELLNETIRDRGHQYGLKRLVFGTDAANEIATLSSIRHLIPSDVVVERRANEPFEKNRFFCRAPLKTSDHILLLEKMERLAIG